MFEVGVVGSFEAAHSLHGEFGRAARKHGHNYRVEAVVRGPDLRPDGTLLDITILQTALDETLADLDYRDLDDLAPFQSWNSTAEEVARHVFEQLAPRLTGHGLSGLHVRVWESPVAFAGREGPL